MFNETYERLYEFFLNEAVGNKRKAIKDFMTLQHTMAIAPFRFITDMKYFGLGKEEEID